MNGKICNNALMTHIWKFNFLEAKINGKCLYFNVPNNILYPFIMKL